MLCETEEVFRKHIGYLRGFCSNVLPSYRRFLKNLSLICAVNESGLLFMWKINTRKPTAVFAPERNLLFQQVWTKLGKKQTSYLQLLQKGFSQQVSASMGGLSAAEDLFRCGAGPAVLAKVPEKHQSVGQERLPAQRTLGLRTGAHISTGL